MDFAGSVLTETSQTKTSSVLYTTVVRCDFVLLVFFFFLTCQFMLPVFILTFRMMSDDTIILFICNNVFFFSLTSVSTKNYIKYIVFPLKTLVKIHQAFFP